MTPQTHINSKQFKKTPQQCLFLYFSPRKGTLPLTLAMGGGDKSPQIPKINNNEKKYKCHFRSLFYTILHILYIYIVYIFFYIIYFIYFVWGHSPKSFGFPRLIRIDRYASISSLRLIQLCGLQ